MTRIQSDIPDTSGVPMFLLTDCLFPLVDLFSIFHFRVVFVKKLCQIIG